MRQERPGPEIEQEKFGRNIEIHAFFVRHGEKGLSTTSGETALTAEGEEQSAIFGKSHLRAPVVKAYSSATQRTEKTAQLASEASTAGKKLNRVIKDELRFQYDPHGEFARENFAIKRKILGSEDEFKELSPEEQERKLSLSGIEQTDHYLSFGEKRPDPRTFSPVETASLVALRVAKYIRMAERLKPGSIVDFVNATHDYNIAAFLKEVLVRRVEGQRVIGFDSIAEIGGPIDHTESFHFDIKTDAQGSQSVQLYFRGENYEFSQERMNELVEIGKRLA